MKKRNNLFMICAALAGLFLLSSFASYFVKVPEQPDILVDPIEPKTYQAAKFPAQVAPNFKWGVNGHPGFSKDYNWNIPQNSGATGVSVGQQVEYLNELQTDIYRFNVFTNEAGEVVCQFNPNCDEATLYWHATIAEVEANNKDILVMIQQQGFKTHYNDTWKFLDAYDGADLHLAYDFGYNKVRKFAETYGDVIDYYQIANETHLMVRENQNSVFYDDHKLRFMAAFLKGMQQGIIDGDNVGSRFININTGWVFYDLFEKLNDPSLYYPAPDHDYRVVPDILGYHWYSKMVFNNNQTVPLQEQLTRPYLLQAPTDKNNLGNVLENIKTAYPDKEVWLTEISVQDGTQSVTEEVQSLWMEAFVDGLDGHENVTGFFHYELIDQFDHHASNPPDPDKEAERYYGLIKKDALGTNKKKAFTTYKYKIEEVKYGLEDYVYRLIENVNREEPGDLSSYVQDLVNQDFIPFLTDFEREKNYEHFIGDLYWLLMEHEASPTAMAYWLGEMLTNNGPRENIIARIASSQEFYNLSGSTVRGFILRTYNTLMEYDQTPSPIAIHYWENQILNGMTREEFIHELLRSQDYRRTFIVNQYQEWFGIDIDRHDDEVTFWYDHMEGDDPNNHDDDVLQKEVIRIMWSSEAYWEKAIIEGYERRTGFDFE